MQSTNGESVRERSGRVVYDVHRIGQLESFLKLLHTFENDNREQNLYDSFVALTAGTEYPYGDEESEWMNETHLTWQEYIWNIMSTKFGVYVHEINQVADLGDWGVDFKKTLNEFYAIMKVYIKCDGIGWRYANRDLYNAVEMQRVILVAKFYDLLVLLFDVPRKDPRMVTGDIEEFCPRGSKWRYIVYEDEQLRVDYQKKQEWMDLITNGAWLIWCGDNIRDSRVDVRIMPMIRKYKKLKDHLLNGDKNQPIYADLAHAVLKTHTSPSTSNKKDVQSMLNILHASLDRTENIDGFDFI
jgi:hypothetical protein